MSKLYITVGAIGSGKSTWARDLVSKEDNTIIVNRDQIRVMIRGMYTFDYKLESFVKEAANAALEIALDQGLDVVVDECNLTIKRRRELIDVAVRNALCTEITFVVFEDHGNNVNWRMKDDSRGYTRDKWESIYHGMRLAYQQPKIDESEILPISIIQINR